MAPSAAPMDLPSGTRVTIAGLAHRPEVCADGCVGMCAVVCADMGVGTCAYMCTGMCIDMCKDMFIDMCIDMCSTCL